MSTDYAELSNSGAVSLPVAFHALPVALPVPDASAAAVSNPPPPYVEPAAPPPQAAPAPAEPFRCSPVGVWELFFPRAAPQDTSAPDVLTRVTCRRVAAAVVTNLTFLFALVVIGATRLSGCQSDAYDACWAIPRGYNSTDESLGTHVCCSTAPATASEPTQCYKQGTALFIAFSMAVTALATVGLSLLAFAYRHGGCRKTVLELCIMDAYAYFLESYFIATPQTDRENFVYCWHAARRANPSGHNQEFPFALIFRFDAIAVLWACVGVGYFYHATPADEVRLWLRVLYVLCSFVTGVQLLLRVSFRSSLVSPHGSFRKIGVIGTTVVVGLSLLLAALWGVLPHSPSHAAPILATDNILLC